jgi:hypothetical protein
MDISNGVFLHWPLGSDWETNEPVLDRLRVTWKTWHWCATEKQRNKRGWTVEDGYFDDWLNEGRVVLIAPSKMEQWAAEMGYTG